MVLIRINIRLISKHSQQKIPLPLGVNTSSSLNVYENDDIICDNAGWLTPTAVYNYSPETGNVSKTNTSISMIILITKAL